jgi:subtilisin family serine protease
MPLTEKEVLEIIYPRASGMRGHRLIQDTPVLPDVWILFGTQPDKFHNLILTPHSDSSVGKLFNVLRTRAEKETRRAKKQGKEYKISYNDSHVMFQTDYEGLVRIVLPVSEWWRNRIRLTRDQMLDGIHVLGQRKDLAALLTDFSKVDRKALPLLTQHVLDMIRIVGLIGYFQTSDEPLEGGTVGYNQLQKALTYLLKVLDNIDIPPHSNTHAPLWNLFSDRQVHSAVYRSRLMVKADAAIELFKIDTSDICWAVIDSGIDARHPAFRIDNKPLPKSGPFAEATRVDKTLDFTQLADLTSLTISGGETKAPPLKGLTDKQRQEIGRDLQFRLINGQPLDWGVLEALLDIPHTQGKNGYTPPKVEHGTHVAGIIGANWDRSSEKDDGPSLYGICPQIHFYDLRIALDDGSAQESVVLAAMQYVRFKNANRGRMVIHGVNLSLSLVHNVKTFSCGHTPVCDEANRMVANGISVVAAAGNSGMGDAGVGAANDYRAISITDPGNAEDVITVGSTHYNMPHRYGVSYFSSRGPTGDGRMKPDLVAPGEQILSTIPNEDATLLDGTSMAAPHVSGAAALLMARHQELRGDPLRVKQILCRTATDLGRERVFQGAGLLDVLRAVQSI